MKILILEDEIPAYQKLLIYLNDTFENNFSHDIARSNADGKTLLIQNLKSLEANKFTSSSACWCYDVGLVESPVDARK